jgi:beta-mannosidase
MPLTSPCAWEVGPTSSPELSPARFVPARVPGAVQLDWARAEGWGDPHVADNWQQYLPLEDLHWVYRTTLRTPPLVAGQRLLFVCGGIDYQFQIRLGGAVLLEQEGMFTPVRLDLTDRARVGDTLEVLIFPHPKSHDDTADRSQANHSCKPAVSYGWDFHPRLLPSGIWEAAALVILPACHLTGAEVHYDLNDELSRADLRLDVSLTCPGSGRVQWELFDRAGHLVHTQEVLASDQALALSTVLEGPELWWPHDQGEPVLYTSRVSLLDADGNTLQTLTSRVGFRRVRLVMHPGAWDEPHIRRFPKGPSCPPITLEVNGRALFAKGANWVSPDIFPGRITVERYAELLGLVKAAHMNLLRCWGGAIVQKEAFFDLCDELGIMVWQEFPLACNRYAGTPAYLHVLDGESRSIIRRLRPHPAVVLWCGGNELFNVWSGMTEQDLPIRLLNRNCFDLDPARPFLPTSPVMGMGHGHYIFRSPEGQEVFQLFADAHCTAYTEFGCGGPSSAAFLRAIIPADELFPPTPGTAWETHHALGAWEPNSHLLLDVIERYFGPMTSLETLVACGQLLQAEGLKCLFEEARRQKPRAAMALNWCLNEPWPTAANMSILEWPATPKAAYFAVRDSLRPVLASAKILRFTWTAGECFAVDLWLLNDAPQALPAGRVEAILHLGDAEHFLLGWDHPGVAANTNLAGPTVRHLLPNCPAESLELILRVPARPEWESRYYLRYTPTAELLTAGTRRLNQ